MERFVTWMLAGGLATLAGLWLAALSSGEAVRWLGVPSSGGVVPVAAGAVVALFGLGALGYGIAGKVTLDGST